MTNKMDDYSKQGAIMLHHLHKLPLRFAIFFAATLLFNGCAGLGMKAKPDYTVDSVDMDFVYVKGGSYQMGSSALLADQPVQTITVDDLFVGMYEVTFDQFEAYCRSVKSCESPPDNEWGRGQRPVININWLQANAYAEWLSQTTGLVFRLPTETEWEYFARAGTTTDYWTGTTLPLNRANCKDCGDKWGNQTAPVGSFPPNPWKIYDTLGNVQEWMLDDYQPVYGTLPDEPKGKSVRGGAWRYQRDELSVAIRDYKNLQKANNSTGFRLVLLPDKTLPIPGKK